ncbi:MAG: hypothetical protein FJY86_03850 [Candidatus Diapherotrites archaeon]|uniref:Uncharacterized protein n=1 Tax=Candidatus Iainarchaeum sp. TaxID=3101447 RepID=A0A8T4C7H3_9ARCH|nr:hypothetical protein [Candidatus Diapherotrites archaeon]
MKNPSKGVLFLVLLLLATLVLGHTTEDTGKIDENLPPHIQLAQTLRENAYNVVGITAAGLILLVAYSIKTKPRKEKIKKILFWSIAILAVGSNLYLATVTVYTNMVSPTQGPVHWHTDYEVWNCGTQLDLIDPTGIDNRVGTWEVHEHNDQRMHIEGTILYMEQASFHHFFEIVGGHVERNGITFPSVNGEVFLPTQGSCNGQPATLQVFKVYVTNPADAKKWEYTQEKLPYPEGLDTIMAPYANVPPGDCLIIEYGPIHEKTERTCASYRAALNRGELHGR